MPVWGDWERRLTGTYVVLALVAAVVVAAFAATFAGAVIAFVGILLVALAVGFLSYVVGRRIYDRLIHGRPLIGRGGGA